MRKQEVISICEISLMLCEFEQIDPWISSGDREPIWDGSINYYKGKGRKNKDLIARIPIQVKGKGKVYKEGAGYPIRVDDLRKFKDEGGVLYYVVYGVDSDRGNRQLAYNFLTPSKINNVLKNIKSKTKTKNIQMKKYNGDKDMFLRDIEKFIIDRKLQRGHTDEEWPKIDEIPHKDIKRVVFNNTVKKGEGVESFVNYNDFNIYYEVKGSKLLHPIDTGNIVRTMIGMKNGVKVEVGGVTYEDTTKLVDNNFDKIGNPYNTAVTYNVIEGFSLQLNTNNNELRLLYTIPTTLKKAENWVRIMESVCETGEIKIKGLIIETKVGKELITSIQRVKESLVKYRALINLLGIDEDLQIVVGDESHINELYEGKVPYDNKGEVTNEFGLYYLDVGEGYLLFLYTMGTQYMYLHFIEKEGRGNMYQIDRGLKGDIVHISLMDMVKLYNNMGYYDIIKTLNFNYTHYVEVFKDEGVDRGTATYALLKLIHVADGLHGEEREEVLRYCYTLATEKFDTNNFTHKVNMCQVLYRMGRLTTKQKMELRELSDKSDINCFLVELLTGTPEMAGYHFNRLGDEEKEFLEKLPIYTLYEESSKV